MKKLLLEDPFCQLREISDAAGGDGLPLLIGSDADDVHARRYRRLQAGDAVLENQAVVGFDAQGPGGDFIALGVGLRPLNVFGAHEVREVLAETQAGNHMLDTFSVAGRDQGRGSASGCGHDRFGGACDDRGHGFDQRPVKLGLQLGGDGDGPQAGREFLQCFGCQRPGAAVKGGAVDLEVQVVDFQQMGHGGVGEVLRIEEGAVHVEENRFDGVGPVQVNRQSRTSQRPWGYGCDRCA